MVTDFEKSFAVFTYRCGDLSFSGNATIGFVTTDGLFEVLETSFNGNAQSVACQNFPESPWVNIVYSITSQGI